MRSSSCSMVAMAVGGPPQWARSSLWITPWGFFVRWLCSDTSVLSSLRSLLIRSRTESCCRGVASRRGSRALGPPGARHPVLLALVEQRAHLLGRQQPGQAEVVLLVGGERRALVDQLVELGVRLQRGEGLLVLTRLVLGALRPGQQLVVPLLVGAVRLAQARGRAAPPARSPAPAAPARRARTPTPSPPPAATARTGRPPGRRTAASRRSWRTRPTARRGTSTPSLTIRTATIHCSSDAANRAMRADAPGSSESTTAGGVPVMSARIAA